LGGEVGRLPLLALSSQTDTSASTEIQAERDRKLETAREQRENRRHWAA